VVVVARALGYVVPELAAVARRLELMWFGQRQVQSTVGPSGLDARSFLKNVLRGKDA